MSSSPRITDEQRLAEIDAALRPVGPAASVPEVPVARLRRTTAVLVIPALVLVAGAFGAAYLPFRLPEPWGLVAGVGCALAVVVVSLYPLLLWLATAYTITTRRIILRSGLFVRVRREVAFGRIRDVTVRRNPLHLLSGSGNVRIALLDDEPIVLRSVPRPALVFAALQELAERSFAVTGSHGPGLRPAAPSAPPPSGPALGVRRAGPVDPPAPAPDRARAAAPPGFQNPTDPGFTSIISGR